MKITAKEIESVSRLNAFERYKYFIKKVADSERMYSLKNKNDEWAIAEVDNYMAVSLWSAIEFAQEFVADEWKYYSVIEVNLKAIEEVFIPFIKSDGYLLNIFSVGDKTGFIVNIEEFMRDLNEEVQKYI